MTLNLSVDIDKNSGYCFGVVEAINKAENELDKGVELYCLGDLVHNDEEIKRLKKKGIKIINKETFNNLTNKNVLFRAHGEPPETYKQAADNNIAVVDASCPIIKKLQQKIKDSYKNNENIVIYGRPNHPEVIALNGQIDHNGIIIQNKDEIDFDKIPQKITLYSQTTQSLDGFYELLRSLQNAGKEVKVKDTICRTVSNRRAELENFCKNYHKILFVAGKRSSNGKVLFEVCKNVNPNSFFISKLQDIDQNWFDPEDRIGVAGATSTPKWLMEKVKEHLESI